MVATQDPDRWISHEQAASLRTVASPRRSWHRRGTLEWKPIPTHYAMSAPEKRQGTTRVTTSPNAKPAHSPDLLDLAVLPYRDAYQNAGAAFGPPLESAAFASQAFKRNHK